MNPKYPIYIISKGRWENPLTARTFDYMNVPYQIVVEPSEYRFYKKTISKEKILKLPENFSKKGQGSIPVRNWVWKYSLKNNDKRHWIVDDNIHLFFRFNRNLKVPVDSGTIFKCMEDFTDRYENIAFSGPNYFMFASRKTTMPAFYLNTRIYSCILINNSLDLRWRGKYNEDTDICIRALKKGYCTILFNAFLQGKTTTMKMKGGNTDTIYNSGDNRKEFAESLKNQHPDVVKVTKKWGRWHHHVNYKPFQRNKLIKKDIKIKQGMDNYGMELIKINKNESK